MNPLIAAIAAIYDLAMLDSIALHAVSFYFSQVMLTGIFCALFTVTRRRRIWR
jgi:hypothetical protein